MNIILFSRDEGRPIQPVGVELRARRYAWAAVGGPAEAVIEARGRGADLRGLLDWVGCGVEIWSAAGRPVWWGYISRVETPLAGGGGRWRAAADLEAMCNRAAAAYTRLEAGPGALGERGTTPWAEDAVSVAELGRKEELLALAGATDQAALAARDRFLAERRFPTAALAARRDWDDEPMALLYCRGWWERLSWRFAAVPAQLALGVEAAGALERAIGDGQIAQLAQGFETTAAPLYAARVGVCARRVGQPVDALRLALYTTAENGSPGSLLASVTVAAEQLSADFAWVEADLLCPLTAGSSFFLVIGRTGAADAANGYAVRLNEPAGWGAGPLLAERAGWWYPYAGRLAFRMYENALVETSRQVQSLITAYGAGLGRVEVAVNSGIFTQSWRDGDSRARYEIEALLRIGTANGRRMLAEVAADGGVRVYEQPAPDDGPYRLDAAGRFYDPSGQPVDPQDCPAGIWVLPQEMLDAGRLEVVTGWQAFFVERMLYEAASGALICSADGGGEPLTLVETGRW